MSSFATRVMRGASFLDEHDPDWWRADVPNAIDVDQLDLGDIESCVLGQRCPLEADDKYSAELYRITGATSGLNTDVLQSFAIDHGFSLVLDGRQHWTRLTAEWKLVIEARRAGAS